MANRQKEKDFTDAFRETAKNRREARTAPLDTAKMDRTVLTGKRRIRNVNISQK